MSVLALDFETHSLADLKKTGAAVYAAHPCTGISCMAYAFDNEPADIWVPGQPFPQRIMGHILGGGEVHGWNVMFEYYIWTHVLTRFIPDLPCLPLGKLRCTMARAAYWGLPMSLEQAGAAIGAQLQKDKVGHALMLRMSKPRRLKADGTPVWWHHEDAQKFLALQHYCMRDVDAEREIASRLPPLPADELEIWRMDAEMNRRGLMVDVPLVNKFKAITDAETRRLSKHISQITNGAVASVTAVAALTRWLNLNGVSIESLAKAELADLLNDPSITGAPREALLIRKEAAKTSTAKLNAMIACVGGDYRVRGLVQHYGANRTGRWAGRLVQVQNLPRPAKSLDTDMAIRQVLKGADPETLQFAFGPVLDVVSSCLRGCFVAAPGFKFAVCDFSAIEARVVAWLAGQQDILDVFASGEDVYVFTANRIGSDDRQLGKVAVLGLGFGMGAVKFVDAAKTYKITLTQDRAQEVVSAWRKANAKIVKFWYDLEAAVRHAIEHPTDAVQVGKLRVRMGRASMAGSLLIILPSGRHLVYRNARLEYDGDGYQSITYDGINQYTRKWEPIRTYGGKLAENVTQAVARCLLADAMLRMEQHGLELVGSIHDEVICEENAMCANEAFQIMKNIMSTGPTWANGLPLGGAGWVGPRYGKA